MSNQSSIFFWVALQFRFMVFAGLVFFTLTSQALTLEEAIESAIKVDPSLRASKFNGYCNSS